MVTVTVSEPRLATGTNFLGTMIDALSTKNLTNSAVTQPSPGVNEVTYSTDPGSGMNADVTVDWNGVPPDQIMTDMSVSLDETVDFTISGLNINFMTFNNAVQADRPDKAAGIAKVFQASIGQLIYRNPRPPTVFLVPGATIPSSRVLETTNYSLMVV